MNSLHMLRVSEQDRRKLAWMLVPFTIIFLAVGVVSAMNYLHAARYRGPGWLIIVAGIAAAPISAGRIAFRRLVDIGRSTVSHSRSLHFGYSSG